LLTYVGPYRQRLILGILFGFLFGGSTFGGLMALRAGFDHFFEQQESIVTQALRDRLTGLVIDAGESTLAVALGLLAVLMAFAVLRGIGFYLSKFYVEWVGHRVVLDLRNQLFAHIQDLALVDLNERRTGELMSRTSNDTQMVERAVSTVIGDLVREPFVLATGMVLLVVIDVRLAAISILLFPICIVPVAFFGRRVRLAGREAQARLGDLASIQQETITGSRVVKAFGTEDQEKRRFGAFASAVFRREIRVTRARAAVTPVIEFVSILTICALLVYARYSGLTAGDLFLFFGAMALMYDPAKKLSRIHMGLQQASAAADRIFEVLDMPITVKDRPHASAFGGQLERIHFEDVSFRFGEEWVLRHIQLEVQAGECVALVGSSGAGKTTLVSLLPRFYDVTEGRITMNGTDLRDLTLRSLRGLIGLVTQETILFNRTVAENIAYGAETASRTEIEGAARRAHAHGFIRKLEHGYDTMIGERGGRLSGGQRQRLAIARALLRNPPVLILDEATSALDTESERQVQAALDELMEGRTVFAIAHRLSTIQHADRILVLDRGRIIEEGTHLQLRQMNGAYRHFYDLQFQGLAAGAAAQK
jgi:subfamily B ATP-binding cassette protein MsbA